MTARIVKLILTDDHRRGRGTDDDPVRMVPRLYTLDGRMVVEADPEQGGREHAHVDAMLALIDDREPPLD